MACGTITSITYACEGNVGGVKNVYLIAKEDVLTITKTSNVITTVTLASGASFQSFAFNRNTASMNENATVNVENGSNFYDQTVTLKIRRRETTKRNALAAIMQRDLIVIVQDMNGIYWLLGETNGMYVSELPSESGAAKGDFNGYTVTLKGEEEFQANEVDSTIIAGLL